VEGQVQRSETSTRTICILRGENSRSKKEKGNIGGQGPRRNKEKGCARRDCSGDKVAKMKGELRNTIQVKKTVKGRGNPTKKGKRKTAQNVLNCTRTGRGKMGETLGGKEGVEFKKKL